MFAASVFSILPAGQVNAAHVDLALQHVLASVVSSHVVLAQ
jgi:hypothetical protein